MNKIRNINLTSLRRSGSQLGGQDNLSYFELPFGKFYGLLVE